MCIRLLPMELSLFQHVSNACNRNNETYQTAQEPTIKRRRVWADTSYTLGRLSNIAYSTCGLVAMTSAQHAEGRQFDPGQVYCCDAGMVLSPCDIRIYCVCMCDIDECKSVLCTHRLRWMQDVEPLSTRWWYVIFNW